jgi:hypothetical protein
VTRGVVHEKKMIDQTTGTVTIPGRSESISPDLTRSGFLSSALAGAASVCVKNEPWCSWDLPVAVADGKKWYVRLQFHADLLTRVEVTVADPNERQSWSDWSREKELDRKAQHDALLSHDLGTPPYAFAWGKIFSVFDERSGGSSIIVDYKNKEMHNQPMHGTACPPRVTRNVCAGHGT